MKTIVAMTVGLLALAGCQTETVEQKAERYMMEPYIKAQTVPSLVARTYAPPSAIESIVEKQCPFDPRVVGNGVGYHMPYGEGGPWGFSTDVYVVVVPWKSGTEIRLWADDDTPKFDLRMTTMQWGRISDRVEEIPAQSWLVYPPDPAGQYASKKFGAPKPGSPEITLN